jgi:hypothetical protein
MRLFLTRFLGGSVARFVFLSLLVLLNGCGAGWRRTPDLGLGPLPRRQQAQIWHNGRSERWHAVDVTVDSVSGVPFLEDPGCERCRVALPRAAVDSMRFGHPARGFWKTLALVVGVPALVVVIACGGPSKPCAMR